MIQIGEIRKGFSFIQIAQEIRDIPWLLKNWEKVAAAVPEARRWNLYYTVAHHAPGQRTHESFKLQEVIPFDLDQVDGTQWVKYRDIFCTFLGLDPEKLGIVNSGNGLHFLIEVTPITSSDYFKKYKKAYGMISKKLEALFKDARLPIGKMDTSVFEGARVFRLPGTKNVKQKGDQQIEKDCFVLQANMGVQKFNWDLGGTTKDDDTPRVNGKVDMATVMEECLFLKEADEYPHLVKEPDWYMILSITSRFPDNNETSRRLTAKFSSSAIDAADKEQKIEQAFDASGPRTCEGINARWGKCSQCPHFGKISSPVTLKSDDFIATEDQGFTIIVKGKPIRQHRDLLLAFKRDRFPLYLPSKQILGWNGKNFEPMVETEIRQYAEHRFVPDPKSSEKAEFLQKVLDDAFTRADLVEQDNEGLINMENGVLDIETKQLKPHDTGFGFRYCLPYGFDPNATAPNWEKFIEEVTLGREGLASVLQEFVGFIIRGGPYRFQSALILAGSGKNGKSTFVDVVQSLVGDENCASTALTSLARNTFASASLYGKLLNISEEEPPESFKETGPFKNITGGNKIEAQFKYGNPFTFRNRAKMIITYNEMPYLKDTSVGMQRRLLIVPFDFDLEKQPDRVDPEIREKLLAELPGIFNWALEGWERLKKNRRFTRTKWTKDAVEEILNNSDQVHYFLTECVENVGGKFVSFKELYEAYQRFNADEGSGTPSRSEALVKE